MVHEHTNMCSSQLTTFDKDKTKGHIKKPTEYFIIVKSIYITSD